MRKTLRIEHWTVSHGAWRMGNRSIRSTVTVAAIARMLLLEAHRERERQSDAMEELVSTQNSSPVRDPVTLEALLHCLGKLPEETRTLVLDYYQGDKQLLIEQRKGLAERRGIPLNALRLRVNRIRLQLERCVSQTQPDVNRTRSSSKGK